ncbi:MAG: hypothetical protein ABEJ56_05635 [Candidatus Nanohaloarchaea archaeon]
MTEPENVVEQVVRRRFREQDERVEELSALDKVSLNDAKARREELRDLIDELSEKGILSDNQTESAEDNSKSCDDGGSR